MLLISQGLLPPAPAERRRGVLRPGGGGDGSRGAAAEERREHGEQAGAEDARHPSDPGQKVPACPARWRGEGRFG